MSHRICLNMIVRNEAHVIARCLASVKPFVDSWLIVDTGSTDGTQQRIRELMGDLPGALHERPWKNFGHNRSEAIALARPMADYSFVIDADEVLVIPPGFQPPVLTADAYDLKVNLGGIEYGRTCLVANRLPWRWEGALHEYLECDQPIQAQRLEAPSVLVFVDGARSQQGAQAKYAADAKLLEAELVAHPGNARNVFYLAQSYRDCGQAELALKHYERRAAMGGWEEEVWYSLYSAALLAEQLEQAPDAVIARYQRAHEARPIRGAETLGQLARYCRLRNRFELARVFAAGALSAPQANDRLFVDPSWRLWRGQDELSLALYWTDRFAEAKTLFEALLANAALPAAERPRIEDNLRWACRKLSGHD